MDKQITINQMDLAFDFSISDVYKQTNTSAVLTLVNETLQEKIKRTTNNMLALMESDWSFVIAASFGKDSSVLISLVLKTMELYEEKYGYMKPVHVMHSDTGYENPIVHAYAQNEINRLESYCAIKHIPLKVWVAKPNLSNDYLVLMIGGRTIATFPENSRKCQQYLKASPLQKTYRKIATEVSNSTHVKNPNIAVLIGTRFDESIKRQSNMSNRGETYDSPVWNDVSSQWTLSPIAHFTDDDIFEYIGLVTSGIDETYSDFVALAKLYRDSMGGECMVNVFSSGGSSKSAGCGARHGCFICTSVQEDRSMINLINNDNDEYAYLKPLNDFRNYIKSRHYDWSSRNWLARSIAVDGSIKISPNAYSPDFCLDLLRYALTIDAEEMTWAQMTGNNPRFQLMSYSKILMIDVMWNRYGYNKALMASKTYNEIFNEGVRYKIPENPEVHIKKPLPISRSIPFVDDEFNYLSNGLHDVLLDLVDPGNACDHSINVENELSIDEESAALFFEFELEHALESLFSDDEYQNPMAGIHYLLRLGVVAINKGGHSRLDGMMRIGNQIHRHGLRKHLDDPEKIIEIMSAHNNDDTELLKCANNNTNAFMSLI